MIAYIIQVLLFQVLFLAVYDFFLSKETFHNYNRWYLLGTPMISFVLPVLKTPTFQKAIPQELMVYFPEIMLSPEKVIEQAAFYTETSVNYIRLIFLYGVVLFTLVFLFKLYKIFRLIYKNETIQKIFYKLVLLPKQTTAFSFFHFIFLGKDISKEKQEDIIQHELIHSKQMHSLDLLFFEFLRIAMWFNPMIYFYQQRITLLHEYISDAEVVKTTEKHDYFNKLLSQTFQVENISFVNQFHKHSLIKKRITMMTKNKSKQIKKAKYLLLLPLLASMLFYTSCGVDKKTSTVIEVEEVIEEVVQIEEVYEDVPFAFVEEVPVLKKASTVIEVVEEVQVVEIEEVYEEVSFAVIEEVPVFPGCTGTRKEKSECLNKGIRRFVVKNFNADVSKGLPKGRKKIWIVFRIDENGNVTNINARAPHPKLKEEAMRVARLLPKMEPGKQLGKAVGMKYTLPISFTVE